jgi:hypothetical protein
MGAKHLKPAVERLVCSLSLVKRGMRVFVDEDCVDGGGAR